MTLSLSSFLEILSLYLKFITYTIPRQLELKYMLDQAYIPPFFILHVLNVVTHKKW